MTKTRFGLADGLVLLGLVLLSAGLSLYDWRLLVAAWGVVFLLIGLALILLTPAVRGRP